MTAKTVLILGAGASMDAHFPSGNRLIDHIIHFFNDEKNIQCVMRIIYNNIPIIRRDGLSDQFPEEFQPSLRGETDLLYVPLTEVSRWTRDLHHFESIDQFIYHRKEYSLIAKICMVLTLSRFEKQETFEHTQLAKEGDHWSLWGVNRIWYHSLWRNLISESPTPEEFKIRLATLHFITFNYDRSLDYFLLKAIKAVYPNSDIKPKDLPITHVYGDLGSLERTDEKFRQYQVIGYSALIQPETRHERAHSIPYNILVRSSWENPVVNQG